VGRSRLRTSSKLEKSAGQGRAPAGLPRSTPPLLTQLAPHRQVYQVDPLVCSRRGQRMQILAFLTDSFAIEQILDHLGLNTPPLDKPPPLREVLHVAEYGDGWSVPAEWE